MPNGDHDSWTDCRGRLPAFVETGRKAHKQVEAVMKACADGSLDAARQAVERLGTEANNLLAAALEISNALPASPSADQFASAIESLARSHGHVTPVVRAGNRVLLGATVVRVRPSAQGSMTATVGSRELITSSAVTIIEEVNKQSKEKFDHRKVTKALKDAFTMHVALQGTDPGSAMVSLEDIRRIIGITRDGSGYSHDEMTNDIQMLAVTFHKEMSDAGVTLLPSPAARVQFELMLESGTIANLAVMQLTKTTKGNS